MPWAPPAAGACSASSRAFCRRGWPRARIEAVGHLSTEVSVHGEGAPARDRRWCTRSYRRGRGQSGSAARVDFAAPDRSPSPVCGRGWGRGPPPALTRRADAPTSPGRGVTASRRRDACDQIAILQPQILGPRRHLVGQLQPGALVVDRGGRVAAAALEDHELAEVGIQDDAAAEQEGDLAQPCREVALDLHDDERAPRHAPSSASTLALTRSQVRWRALAARSTRRIGPKLVLRTRRRQRRSPRAAAARGAAAIPDQLARRTPEDKGHRRRPDRRRRARAPPGRARTTNSRIPLPRSKSEASWLSLARVMTSKAPPAKRTPPARSRAITPRASSRSALPTSTPGSRMSASARSGRPRAVKKRTSGPRAFRAARRRATSAALAGSTGSAGASPEGARCERPGGGADGSASSPAMTRSPRPICSFLLI